MLKKMMLMALSVGALVAFAVPAVAQANVSLEDESGGALAVGADVTATSVNLKTTLNPPAAAPALECAKVTLHMTVGTNGPNQVKLHPYPEKLPNGEHNPLRTATTQGCVLNLNGTTKVPATITDGTVKELVIDTWGTGDAEATFRSDVPALELSECALTGNVHVLATDATDILDVEPSVLKKEAFPGQSAGCGAAGTIEGEFTLETSNGEPVTVNAVNTP